MRRSFLVVGVVAIAAVMLGAECQKAQEGGGAGNVAAKEGELERREAKVAEFNRMIQAA